MVEHTTSRNSSTSRHNSNNGFWDNQGSLKLAHNPIFHSRTKHVDVQHHFIKEKVELGQVTLDYVSIGDRLTDILTKLSNSYIREVESSTQFGMNHKMNLFLRK